jgi:hypothetical protein
MHRNRRLTLFMFQTAAAEVDDLNSTLRRMFQKHILHMENEYYSMRAENLTHLWFEIAMNDTMMSHQRQRHEHLTRKSSNQSSGKPSKSVSLDKLIKVDTKQFHRNTKMASEVEMFVHHDNMMLLFCILYDYRRLIDTDRKKNKVTRTHFFKLSKILISTSAW